MPVKPTTSKRTALITGAGRRLGKKIAGALADDGWAVALHYNRSGDTARAQANSINDAGGQAVAIRADLAVEDEARNLLKLAAASLVKGNGNKAGGKTEYRFDLLINNAAAFLPEGDDAPRDVWQTHMDVNLRAPYLLSWAFAQSYSGAAETPVSSQGLIINILDRSVISPPSDFASYTAAKSALWTLTQTLASALAPKIRVNAVGPGPTMRHQRQSADHFAGQARVTPLDRHTDPREIADAVRFLIATQSLTGQILLLDNGHHLL